MPDPRFFEDLGPITTGELAAIAGAAAPSPDDAARAVAGVAPLERAGAEEVSFFADRRYLDQLAVTAAGACFVPAQFAERLPAGCVALVTPEPQAAYARAAMRLHAPRRLAAGAEPLDPSAELEPDVSLGPGVVLGPGVRIGRGAVIGANTVIGPGVCIGRGCRIGANVTIGFALIGDDVTVLSGAVIGEAGFGVAGGRAGAVDVPQLGRVVIQDHVSIGACTCIDRGAWDDTVIGESTKIDNLVQIAHNVRLGRSCLLAAHTGISGSVTVGDGAMFGGRAGIADHVNIGAGAQVTAASGVMHDIPPGERWAGYPAKPARRFMRETAWLAKMAAQREGTSER